MTQIIDSKPRYSTQTFDCIVALAQSVRANWDTAGLRDSIRKCLQRDDQPTLAEVAYAVVRCAENFTIASPAVIPMDGPHWRKVVPEHVPPSAVKCPRCGSLDMPDEATRHRCKRRSDRVGQFTDQLRAELHSVPRCPHGVRAEQCRDCTKAREHAEVAGSRRADDTEEKADA